MHVRLLGDTMKLSSAWGARTLLFAALAACQHEQNPVASAAAQPPSEPKVTVTVNGVMSDQGSIIGTLCPDPALFGKLECPSQRATAPAKPGAVDLVFTSIPPGTYGLTAWHDANSDGRTNLPQEGFGFGNNTPPPPKFEAAAIRIDGDTAASLNLLYLVRPAAPGAGDAGAAAPAGATKIDVREAGLYGALYVPQDARSLPAIIALGGSEGGLDVSSNAARSFVQHGYVVLALAYWRAPGLPQSLENVRLEYFKQAIDWLKARPDVDPQRVGILGMSRGAEGALLAASTYPEIKAVIAVAPSSYSWPNSGMNMGSGGAAGPRNPAWTLGGKPVPFLTQKTPPVDAPPGNLPPYEAALADAPRNGGDEIQVERINGPVLLFSGEADTVWPVKLMGDRIMSRLKARDFGYAYNHLAYPGAGHIPLFGDPAGAPSGYAAVGAIMGGTDEANAAARRDAWPKALAFFDQALKR
jgi:uncharacterized protein